MFCPNCGTENDDSSKTCKKCGFNLKGAAAPKFKGTMLMMNSPQQGGVPRPSGAPAAPGAPAAGGPKPAAATPVPSKLKGTMLGVAPPSFGAPQPPGAMGTPAGPPVMQPPPAGMPPAGMPPAGMPPANPAPGYPQAGDVNPLGGTMVADPGAMGGQHAGPYGAPPAAYGAPPGGAPMGPPPGAPMGPPPGAMGYDPSQPIGGPPMGGPPMGGPPMGGPPMGPPPGAPMGPPPGAPMGGPPGMAPMGPPPGAGPGMPGMQGGPMVHAGGPMPMTGPHGPIGVTRNPVMVFVLANVTCGLYGIWQGYLMLQELKAFRQKDDINLIMFLIPVLGLLEMMKLSDKVAEAKRMAGSNKPAASGILYILLGVYFLPADLNDVWEAARAGGGPR